MASLLKKLKGGNSKTEEKPESATATPDSPNEQKDTSTNSDQNSPQTQPDTKKEETKEEKGGFLCIPACCCNRFCCCLPCAQKKDKDPNKKCCASIRKRLRRKEDEINEKAMKYLEKNKCSIIVRAIYTISAVINAVLGFVVILLSILNYVAFPSISVLTSRTLTSGLALISNSVSIICCSCVLCFCCKPSPATMRKNFLVGFTTAVETLLFSLWYLFYQGRWKAVIELNGNKGFLWKITPDSTLDFDDAMSSHMGPVTIVSVCLLVASILTLVGMFSAAYLLQPVNFMAQMRFIGYQILVTSATEFIFIGAFFQSIETYSSSHRSSLNIVLSTGGAIDTIMLILGILRSCTQCCCPLHWITFIQVLLCVISVIYLIEGIVSASVGGVNAKSLKENITNRCNGLEGKIPDFCSKAINGVTKAHNCGKKDGFRDQATVCAGVIGRTYTKMAFFSEAVDSWVALSVFVLLIFMVIALATIFITQYLLHKAAKRKEKEEDKELADPEKQKSAPDSSPEASPESEPVAEAVPQVAQENTT
ncbi:hypothetical protein BLNAU_21001 [Blattamonas nauphoetae]|uniref:Uncharacterized protein n=1 Tax=Blattamonas nauphoetae TaxID=2049346 RepID=A0ABQ9WX64_9EUKA|nr:hypothetical protein BLNAU_21001 [Blattamonas nauphoetae]